MLADQGFLRWLDEHDPEIAAVVRRKRAIRIAMANRPEGPPRRIVNVDVIRDRARDLSDPED